MSVLRIFFLLIGVRRTTQWILSFGFMASVLYLRFLLFYPAIGGMATAAASTVSFEPKLGAIPSVAAALKLLRISNVSESTRGWMTLVHVVEADRVKVASHGSISKSFRYKDFSLQTFLLSQFFADPFSVSVVSARVFVRHSPSVGLLLLFVLKKIF
ncbi:uncharacterized protein [Coffea arabica]|uniref:Uncharacterized protein n=1 Tax=Coffea arabica TaxID=13443 RepID=A0ABM4US72_COFAR